MTQNSSNQDYQNNADGAQIAGGTVKRILKWLGANITLTGSGAETYTFPASTDTLVGRASTDNITNKNLTSATNTFPDGFVVQKVFTQTITDEVSTTAIPNDDTIPQNTEGEECMSLAITPKSATNLLEIDAKLLVRAANKVCSAALFKDSVADALAADKTFTATTGQHAPVVIKYFMVAGTTSEITFKIRQGSNDGSAVDLEDKFSTAVKHALTVTEYKAS